MKVSIDQINSNIVEAILESENQELRIVSIDQINSNIVESNGYVIIVSFMICVNRSDQFQYCRAPDKNIIVLWGIVSIDQINSNIVESSRMCKRNWSASCQSIRSIPIL